MVSHVHKSYWQTHHLVQEASVSISHANMQKTWWVVVATSVCRLFKGIKTASHSYPWCMTYLPKQPDPGSFVEEANGNLSCCISPKVMNHQCERRDSLLCKRGMSETWGHFWGCQSRTRWGHGMSHSTGSCAGGGCAGLLWPHYRFRGSSLVKGSRGSHPCST